VHRSTYYAWKRQVDRHGLEVLRPRERRRPQMPNALPKMIEERIVVFSGRSSVRPEPGISAARTRKVSRMHIPRRHLNYANVVATLALVFAMSGGALAAKHYLINSTKQINPKVLKSLKGNTGAAGAPGAQGKEGPSGKEGSQGKEGKEGPPNPNAVFATNAGHATSADSATVANSLPAPTVHPLSFGTGWGVSGFAAREPAYSKDAQGYVHLQGAAARSSGTSGIIGTLPPGFRPSSLVYLTVYTAFDHLGTIVIDESGNINYRSGEVSFVSLEGVSFLAEK
jgi:hypothetical protein